MSTNRNDQSSIGHSRMSRFSGRSRDRQEQGYSQQNRNRQGSHPKDEHPPVPINNLALQDQRHRQLMLENKKRRIQQEKSKQSQNQQDANIYKGWKGSSQNKRQQPSLERNKTPLEKAQKQPEQGGQRERRKGWAQLNSQLEPGTQNSRISNIFKNDTDLRQLIGYESSDDEDAFINVLLNKRTNSNQKLQLQAEIQENPSDQTKNEFLPTSNSIHKTTQRHHDNKQPLYVDYNQYNQQKIYKDKHNNLQSLQNLDKKFNRRNEQPVQRQGSRDRQQEEQQRQQREEREEQERQEQEERERQEQEERERQEREKERRERQEREKERRERQERDKKQKQQQEQKHIKKRKLRAEIEQSKIISQQEQQLEEELKEIEEQQKLMEVKKQEQAVQQQLSEINSEMQAKQRQKQEFVLRSQQLQESLQQSRPEMSFISDTEDLLNNLNNLSKRTILIQSMNSASVKHTTRQGPDETILHPNPIMETSLDDSLEVPKTNQTRLTQPSHDNIRILQNSSKQQVPAKAHSKGKPSGQYKQIHQGKAKVLRPLPKIPSTMSITPKGSQGLPAEILASNPINPSAASSRVTRIQSNNAIPEGNNHIQVNSRFKNLLLE